jgi:hypothetical protein
MHQMSQMRRAYGKNRIEYSALRLKSIREAKLEQTAAVQDGDPEFALRDRASSKIRAGEYSENA